MNAVKIRITRNINTQKNKPALCEEYNHKNYKSDISRETSNSYSNSNSNYDLEQILVNSDKKWSQFEIFYPRRWNNYLNLRTKNRWRDKIRERNKEKEN